MKKEDVPISACLIVYNEEHRIADCLESLRHAVDEIILVHDGPCSDRTLEMAESYGVTTYIVSHFGNCDPHRAFAISRCRSDWILEMDADERLSRDLAEKLRDLADQDLVDAYIFDWVTRVGTREIVLKKKVFFRKCAMYNIGFPHLQSETFGREKYVPLALYHDLSAYPSTLDFLRGCFRKDRAWGKKSAQLLAKGIDAIPCYNCRIQDRSLRQVNKIKLMRRVPLAALFFIPVYDFLYSYFVFRNCKYGYLGFATSLHVAFHDFFACWYYLQRGR